MNLVQILWEMNEINRYFQILFRCNNVVLNIGDEFT